MRTLSANKLLTEGRCYATLDTRATGKAGGANPHLEAPWNNSTGARTAAGKAACSQNVVVGQRNRQKALEQAMIELSAAQAKVRRLTAKRGKPSDNRLDYFRFAPGQKLGFLRQAMQRGKNGGKNDAVKPCCKPHEC